MNAIVISTVAMMVTTQPMQNLRNSRVLKLQGGGGGETREVSRVRGAGSGGCSQGRWSMLAHAGSNGAAPRTLTRSGP